MNPHQGGLLLLSIELAKPENERLILCSRVAHGHYCLTTGPFFFFIKLSRQDGHFD